jgi:magnesium transporter
VNVLLRGEAGFITPGVGLYLRDCYDHCVQLADVVETYREMAGGLLNTYLSSMANRTNEVMKVLTIMASIFIPLTFLAGLYGMNFDRMPELHIWWAYPALLLVMAAVAMAMLLFFRRRGWLGAPKHPDAENERR